MNDRKVRWMAQKFMFEDEIEELLSHCPNMTGEDDLRDICEGNCLLYELYCISIEPSFDSSEQSMIYKDKGEDDEC